MIKINGTLYIYIYIYIYIYRRRSWFRHYGTNRKVAGATFDEVSHTIALGSTQPLTEMSTRNLPGGKGAAGA
jgi:hypothetical protein